MEIFIPADFREGEVASLSSQLISRLYLATFLDPEVLIISSANPISNPSWLGASGWTCASGVVPAPSSLQSVSLSSAGQWFSCMAHGAWPQQSHNVLFLPSADCNPRQASLERGKCCLHTRSWRGSHFGWCKAQRDVCKGVNQKHLVKGFNTGYQGGKRWVTSESLSRHWVRDTSLYRLLLGWRRLSAAHMHQTGEAKSCPSLIAMSLAATWGGLNRVKRKSQRRSNDHVWKNLSKSVSINAAVSSLTVFQVPRPVLMFLDPKQVSLPQMDAPPWGMHLLPEGIGPLPAAAISGLLWQKPRSVRSSGLW